MDGRPTKRSRGMADSGSGRRKGMFATMRFSKAQPWATYGAARVERGTPSNLAMFGQTWRSATDEQKANRKRHAYSGRGLYTGRGGFWSDMWDKSAGLRSQLGGMARSSSNPWLQAAGQIARATGIGEYSTGVVKNDLIDNGAGQVAPTFAEGPRGVTISHREYIADIFGPETAGVFQNQTFGLNPALVQTFPWLSQVAANYEEYEFKQMIFTYNSTVTDFVASNGQVGTVIIATQYNANDAPFANKQEMMEYDAAVSGKVSGTIMAGVECDPKQNSGSPGKYTRSGPVAPSEDIKTFDLGTLNVATSNTPTQFSNQALGELWVSYTVELRKPKFFVSRALSTQKDIWIGNTQTGGVYLNQLTLGEGQQNRIGGALTTTVTGYPANQNALYYTFPATFAGDVEVSFIVNGVASAAGAGITISTTNPTVSMIPINDMWNDTGGGGAWRYFAFANDLSVPLVNGRFMIKAHYKVVTPTSAATTVDNIIIVTIGGSPNITVRNMEFTVQVYNTGLNYPTTNQAIIQDPETQLVESWPPA